MLIVLNKKILCFVLAAAVITFAAVFAMVSCSASRSCIAAAQGERTVILDAGHGGIDGGASNGTVLEKDLNLLITQELKKELETSGFKVIMTRTADEMIGSKDSISATKKADMRARRAIMDSNKNAIFVSVHMNKFPDESCKGAQVFYGRRNSDSELLAEAISESIIKNVQPENHRLPKKAENNVFLLKAAVQPAVIVECGFLSNKAELTKLIDPDYQKKLAAAVSKGISEYYSSINSQ